MTAALLTADKLLPRGRGVAAALKKRAATVDLDWDIRCRSRFEATDSAGRRIGVFLPRGTVVRNGDTLVAADGSLVVVNAAPQPVLVVRHCAEHGAPVDLTRAAYHLGNRHVAVEVGVDHLKIEPDHVLAAMLRRMHLVVTEETAPFDPESGAYAAHGGSAEMAQGDERPGVACGHDHGHDHAHDHAHDHGHGHGHPHGHDQGHATADAPSRRPT